MRLFLALYIRFSSGYYAYVLEFSLVDDCYPSSENAHKRVIVRALLRDSASGKFLLHEIRRDDAFGKFDSFETPGGGVEEDESFVEALRRECLEETGYRIAGIKELGIVHDEYNLIERENENHFFYCKTIGERHSIHLVSEGDSLIFKTHFLTLEEVIARYREMDVRGVPLLVKRRELPFWELLKQKLLDSR